MPPDIRPKQRFVIICATFPGEELESDNRRRRHRRPDLGLDAA